jgi:DNA-binding XRE family transcriptional regulator
VTFDPSHQSGEELGHIAFALLSDFSVLPGCFSLHTNSQVDIIAFEYSCGKKLKTNVKKPQFAANIKDALGARVRLHRSQAGMTQQVLADRCNIFRSYLSRIENGVSNPSITVVASLAIALKVDVVELFKD